jgi:hypothetical protein
VRKSARTAPSAVRTATNRLAPGGRVYKPLTKLTHTPPPTGPSARRALDQAAVRWLYQRVRMRCRRIETVHHPSPPKDLSLHRVRSLASPSILIRRCNPT